MYFNLDGITIYEKQDQLQSVMRLKCCTADWSLVSDGKRLILFLVFAHFRKKCEVFVFLFLVWISQEALSLLHVSFHTHSFALSAQRLASITPFLEAKRIKWPVETQLTWAQQNACDPRQRLCHVVTSPQPNSKVLFRQAHIYKHVQRKWFSGSVCTKIKTDKLTWSHQTLSTETHRKTAKTAAIRKNISSTDS